MRRIALRLTLAAMLPLAAGVARAAVPIATMPAAVIADPAPDPQNPARLVSLVIPSGDGALNAVLYLAAGAGRHPLLILFHGFPGNEQNLDLAQAARRAGWNVLTLHYRGSWGSPGAFSFAHCEEDGAAALAFMRRRDIAETYAIDPTRIAVAGHSLGGIVAARVAADDPRVLGAFLIDPADIAAIGRSFADPAAREAFRSGEVDGDLPPLAGTSEAAIMAETAAAGPPLDLMATVRQLHGRPLEMIGAQRGLYRFTLAAGAAVPAGGASSYAVWPTDHSFSGLRIALARELVLWLGKLPA